MYNITNRRSRLAPNCYKKKIFFLPVEVLPSSCGFFSASLRTLMIHVWMEPPFGAASFFLFFFVGIVIEHITTQDHSIVGYIVFFPPNWLEL